MEGGNWRPAAQGEPSAAASSGDVSSTDWRTQLLPDARQRIVNKIMETLKKHLPISVPEGINELKKIAVRFEEKIYTNATSQPDYLHRISLKMLSMENKTRASGPINPPIGNSVAGGQNPADSAASIGLQSQVNSQGQSLAMPSVNQSPARQPLLSQNLQNSSGSSVLHGSPALSAVTGLSQSAISNMNQASNLQNISGLSQSSANTSVGQGGPQDIYASAQRQMQGRQQLPIVSQQQQQVQNPHMYQHQLQQQILKQNMQHPSLLQSHIQQQSLMQSNQLQSSQPSLMQMSSSLQPGKSINQQSQSGNMQASPQSGLQQNQLNSIPQSAPSVLQQHPQSVSRQQQLPQHAIHQQTTSMQQHPAAHPQQQALSSQPPQLMGQQSNMSNMQQLGQQNNVSDIQQQQQQQQQQPRLPVQQISHSNMQQSTQMLNQQALSSHQQPQLSAQSNISGMQQQQQQQQQQQLLGTLPNVSGMQSHQRSMHGLQQSKISTQQQLTQKPPVQLMQPQGQQSQQQSSQQQLMSHLQSQPAQLQQNFAMPHQQSALQREMQQRLQASSALPQSQSSLEQQKHSMQSQRGLPEVSSSASMESTAQNASLVDFQEETYQKIKSMKELYLADLNEMHQKIVLKLQQVDTIIPPGKHAEQLEKMRAYKLMLERVISLLQILKSNIQPGLKDKLPAYEKQIISFISSQRKKPANSQTQGQQQFSHTGGPGSSVGLQQSSQLLQYENHANNSQQMNLPVAPTPGMKHGSMPLSTQLGVPTTQQNSGNVLQPNSSLDTVQGSSFSSLQQGALGSMQQGGFGSLQNSITAAPQSSMNALSHSSLSTLHQNLSPMQPNANVLQQQQHLKQEQQQQLIQNQQMKQQLQQRQLQQQLMQQQQKQQLLQQQPSLQQQLHQQQRQQQMGQLPQHQMPLLHQMNEVNETKQKIGLANKSGVYQQHLLGGQRHNYYQQLKMAPSFPVSSPQNLQASSPQVSQHASPQVDQNSMLSSIPKAGTPLQNASSPFIVPSPSTPLVPSPLPGDSEKQLPGVSSLSNAGHTGRQQTPVVSIQSQQLAVGTPGISASPLLAEFASPDGDLAAGLTGKSNAAERPIDRLIKLVKSSTPKVLSSSLGDIESVVSMIDCIAGSAPGNGSRAAVGEDLVAMTKCRLQARNVMSQDGSATKKMRRHTSAMPLNNVSSAGSGNDSFKQSCMLDSSELESTATSSVKCRKVEISPAIVEEINEINRRLIDTVVSVSDEDVDSIAAAAGLGDGTIVKFSFSAVSLSPNLKAHFLSAQMSPMVPLRLLLPSNYPKCSPVVLDKLPAEFSKESEDLSSKVKSRFSLRLRGLSQPMSLGEMARAWENCAREVIIEYAQQTGGGSFSSTYGTWENCVGA